tara:strand:+ start:5715 stop:6644 length:930 start_codon:yes stop_codon:yes gene_type:complete
MFTDLKIQVPSPLTKIQHPLLDQYGIECVFKRDDLLHPWLSGNKWRKLKYTLSGATGQASSCWVSFGGCFSNHLYALAGAGQLFNKKTVGIIRGEEDPNNPTLQFLYKMGMTCHFVTREQYKKRHHIAYEQLIDKTYPGAFLIPEGGYSVAAMQGMAEVVQELEQQIDYDVLCCAVGSGTTLAGLACAQKNKKRVIGFAALKNASYLHESIQSLQREKAGCVYDYDLELDYHGGGFGRVSAEVADFTQDFVARTGITIEPIYLGKTLFGLFDKIKRGQFEAQTRIVVLHSGGLQGLAGLAYRNLFHLQR